MRLSGAILLGSTMKPQGFRVLSRDGNSCALGAAYDAAGILEAILALPHDFDTRNEKGTALISAAFPNAYELKASCPESCPVNDSTLLHVVVHLNDCHKWTRERIAEWVATVEPSDEPATAPEVAEREIVSVEP